MSSPLRLANSSYLPLTATCEQGEVTSDIQTQSLTPWVTPPPRRLWLVLTRGGKHGQGLTERWDQYGWLMMCRTQGFFLFWRGHDYCRPVNWKSNVNKWDALCSTRAPASSCWITQVSPFLACMRSRVALRGGSLNWLPHSPNFLGTE